MEPTKDYVRKCLEIAQEYLKDSWKLLELRRFRSAVDRAYYAMFYAAKAILASKGLVPPKTHKGLRELFGKEIILKGLIEKDLGRDLTRAFQLRQASTYEVYARFEEDATREIVEKAEKFVNKIKEYIKSSFQLSIF